MHPKTCAAVLDPFTRPVPIGMELDITKLATSCWRAIACCQGQIATVYAESLGGLSGLAVSAWWELHDKSKHGRRP